MSTAATPLAITIVSDTLCPWCFVGKRRLEAALKRIGPRVTATTTWRPFFLDSTMPESRNKREMYAAKFGGEERLRELAQRMTEVCE
jgi:predicted DsbA family dithiol-disulfide isomerase